MICYAIKNEDGMYLGVTPSFEHYWTRIEFAHYFRNIDGNLAEEDAESFRDREYPDCKVIKVEIREVEE